MKMHYAVRYADWEIDEENTPFDPTLNLSEQIEAVPSDKIDERTKRAKVFYSKKEAFKFAKDYLQAHKDNKWLAYLEIHKCESKMIEKLK